MAEAPRDAARRKVDTLARLERDEDVWVASASPDAVPYLVPLSYVWDGTRLTLATPEASPTGRNLAASGRVTVQAWREENELAGRVIMRDGEWLV